MQLTVGAIADLPPRWVVWGRAVVLGSVAFLAGVVSHGVAGGLLPGLLTLTLVLLSCVLGSALLLLGRASALRLGFGVLAGQTWVHIVLSAAAGHRGETAAGELPPLVLDGRGSLLEQYRASTEGVTTSQSDWFSHQIDHFVGQGPLMLAAHLGGAVVVGLFLSVGEDAFWRLAALAVARSQEQGRRALVALLGLCALHGVRRRVPPGIPTSATVMSSQLLIHAVQRLRGPPFVLAA